MTVQIPLTRDWQPIATVPRDGRPVIFANFSAMCLITGSPHVWTGRYHGDQMLECSYAAEHDNGEPTHWMDQPQWPADVTWDGYAPATGAGDSGQSQRQPEPVPASAHLTIPAADAPPSKEGAA